MVLGEVVEVNEGKRRARSVHRGQNCSRWVGLNATIMERQRCASPWSVVIGRFLLRSRYIMVVCES